MSDNVISLTGSAVVQRKPNESCVSELRALLEMAEAGEIVGFAGAILHGDASAAYRVFGTVGGYGMVGAVECVRSHLVDINRSED